MYRGSMGSPHGNDELAGHYDFLPRPSDAAEESLHRGRLIASAGRQVSWTVQRGACFRELQE
jgi:hypothetical protein